MGKADATLSALVESYVRHFTQIIESLEEDLRKSMMFLRKEQRRVGGCNKLEVIGLAQEHIDMTRTDLVVKREILQKFQDDIKKWQQGLLSDATLEENANTYFCEMAYPA